ncbi:caspase family protein [Sodalinema gerasimenkoae]|uniref:caspase family protein n=1 Tax=Sodalinema gerasimenkoae TaxID=2862348 RepID=UPI00135B1116|nr:caspase family protein [Sodalinema gerasimenkoae]
MGHLVLLAVGLDQYHYLQPLRFAVQDAQGLRDHLVGTGRLSPAHCALLTEQSPPTDDGMETEPKTAALEALLADWLPQQVGTEDVVWLFFSGYVLNHGSQDYFLLRDSDPERLPETAIAARGLVEKLQALKSRHITLFLDIRRPTAPQLGQRIGSELVQLAQTTEIPLLLSCQLDERARESRDLRRGLFTTALIAALRYHSDRTLAEIEADLKVALPPLADQCRQPPQTPLLIASEAQKGRSLFVNDAPSVPSPSPETTPDTTPDPIPEATPDPISEAQAPPVQERAVPSTASAPRAGGLWQLVALLGAIASFLMLGVLGNPPSPEREETTPTADMRPDPPETPIDPSQNQEILQQAQDQIDPGQASSYWRAIEQVRQIQPNQPLYDQAQAAINDWSQDILELAERRAEAGQIQFAIDAARLIPDTSPAYERAQQQIATWETQLP